MRFLPPWVVDGHKIVGNKTVGNKSMRQSLLEVHDTKIEQIDED